MSFLSGEGGRRGESADGILLILRSGERVGRRNGGAGKDRALGGVWEGGRAKWESSSPASRLSMNCASLISIPMVASVMLITSISPQVLAGQRQRKSQSTTLQEEGGMEGDIPFA